MSVGQVKIRWAGFTGGPGYTTLNFGPGSPDPVDGAAMVAAADDFAGDLAGLVGDGVTLTAEPEVEWFNEATGVLEDTTSVSPSPTAHTGTSGAIGPLPSGAVISWTTGGINRGRRVRGRTFAVPLAAVAYQSDGSLSATAVSVLNAAAVSLIGATDATFGIWSRPRDGAGGAWFPALTGSTPDMAAVLRSRRD